MFGKLISFTGKAQQESNCPPSASGFQKYVGVQDTPNPCASSLGGGEAVNEVRVYVYKQVAILITFV